MYIIFELVEKKMEIRKLQFDETTTACSKVVDLYIQDTWYNTLKSIDPKNDTIVSCRYFISFYKVQHNFGFGFTSLSFFIPACIVALAYFPLHKDASGCRWLSTEIY